MNDAFSTEQRRARLQTRHLLSATGASVLDAAKSVVVLHATDPATVYLSVLARCRTLSLADVAGQMYDERSVVRLLAMRRTLFVVPREDASVVQHAASAAVASTLRTRLVKQLITLPTDPPLPTDPNAVERWLDEVMDATSAVLRRLGVASGAQLGAAEPRLRTAILPTTEKKYDVRRTITSQVLVLMGVEAHPLVKHHFIF